MNVLFVHNNFPAQFKHVARALVRDPGNAVAAVATRTARGIPGVRLLKYGVADMDTSATHPFARRFDLECRRAEEVLYALTSLQTSGFVPDVIVAHPGWGETLPLRAMFPAARIVAYCEFYYAATNRDVGFDPEFPAPGLDGQVGLHLKNAATLLALADCDIGLSPTEWQRSTYPAQFHDKIRVVHEGVDTDEIRPDRSARFRLPSGRHLGQGDEVVTFVSRNLEPLRGFHVFMRALPAILAARPAAEVVIIGGDDPGYGVRAPEGKTWKQTMLEEVGRAVDRRRVHFVGRVPYRSFVAALQVSSAHVYWTYPFVLSWSLLEAMSAGGLVIASDTEPVRELIDGRNGRLVPFFDAEQLAAAVIEALAHPERFEAMRAEARRHVVELYDSERICVPRTLALLAGEAGETAGAHGAARPSRARSRRVTFAESAD
ncbi:glycosyltransferase family 4 protein [Rhodoplanes sp. TEM]|uniref:Glycosyltransferase family 4 protein n=1 Tax=Rhodoplanes tepidamans TaxID=200616 RepID=A0ABT5JAJ1_RHOTP|nr:MULTISPECIES: glycosyltransferase family 4 protein [Rhodoplanes]MDC7786705.1 glycosyltransferase family 4 protein [Rhodoplanes tepidamans]MDC7983711.1 glycosyltransferase family 4 protein [Rhodoplanes sp. TEM]MDQ0358141.1 glycosyltransferase involved in cell wall biosynthesis [Rhodoplanes tepidamans]